MRPSTILTPLFWIAVTYATMTYGPILVGRLTGKVSKGQFAQALIQQTPETIQSVLSEKTDRSDESQSSSPSVRSNLFLPPVPSNPHEIPEYIREVVNTTTNQVIEKGTESVTETTQQVTQNVCRQIVTEIQKKCDIQTSTE